MLSRPRIAQRFLQLLAQRQKVVYVPCHLYLDARDSELLSLQLRQVQKNPTAPRLTVIEQQRSFSTTVSGSSTLQPPEELLTFGVSAGI